MFVFVCLYLRLRCGVNAVDLLSENRPFRNPTLSPWEHKEVTKLTVERLLDVLGRSDMHYESSCSFQVLPRAVELGILRLLLVVR